MKNNKRLVPNQRLLVLAAVSCALCVLVSAGYAARMSSVLDAAKRGDVEALRSEVRAGGDVNAAQGDGFTALHWAAKLGDREVAEVLIAAGADVRATTRLGNHMPLHVASVSGHVGVADALLAAGAPVDAATGTGAQPIHFAAASGNAGMIASLLAHGAAVDTREPQWGQTPLMFAAGSGRTAAVGALLAAGADPARTASVLDVATRAETDRLSRRARQDRVDAERGDSRAIYDPREIAKKKKARAKAAAAKEKAEKEKGRIAADEAPAPADAGADLKVVPPEDEFAPKKSEGKPTALPLLDYAALVGTHGGLTALLLATRDGHRDTVMALLDGGAGINQRAEGHRTTPLLMAAINGHYDIGMEMLERGADPNLKNISGGAPLYAAINARWVSQPGHPQPSDHLQQKTSHIEFMEALLDAGADINARLVRKQWYSLYAYDQSGVNRAGATAFWRAAYALDIPAMKMLVARGADPHLPTIRVPEGALARLPDLPPGDPSGFPEVPYGGPAVYPIHAASGVGYGLGWAGNNHRHAPDAWLPAVRYLVEELGADPDARDHNGYSVIHHAASRGDNEMIEYLISKGADPLAVARSGQTTVDIANGPVQRMSPFPETIALLESHGAKNNNRCVGC